MKRRLKLYLSRLRKHWIATTIFSLCTVALCGFAYIGYTENSSAATQQRADTAYKVALIIALVGTALFVVYYTRLAPWWRNPIGRTIVLKDLALFLALLPITLAFFFHLSSIDHNVAAAVDLASIAAVGLIMTWRTVVWIRVNREERNGSIPASGTKEDKEGR